MVENDGNESAGLPDGAESIFASWLDRAREGRAEPFEALCEEHAGAAEDLRRFHERIRGLASLFDESLAAAVRPATPGDIGDGRRPFTDVLGRLAEHSPQQSRYEERGRIASGGMGAIERIFDVDLRRELARKTILDASALPDPKARPDPSTLGRFLEEAQVTAQLDHPGVVPVHELGIDQRGQVYFTMALVGGRDLHDVYPLAREEREGWTVTRVVDVLLRVCETIAYAHAKGVIHRDLKPANVMVGEFGEVYVMDWGLARLSDEPDGGEPSASAGSAVTTDRREESGRDPLSPLKTREGEAAGTPQYMSPEQARGELRSLDGRTDVYAVGAMLYALLAGQSPYADVAPRGGYPLIQAISKGPPTPLAEVAQDAPPELVAIAEKAMATDRDARYAGPLEMAEDLRAYLEGRVVRAFETGAWAELRKWIGRNRALAASILVAVLVALTGASGMALVQAQGRARVVAEQARTLRLSDTKVMSDLLAQQASLWPAGPETSAPLAEWLDEARGLLANREQHERDLAELRSRSATGSPDAGGWTFARQEDAWQHEVLLDLMRKLDELPPWIERVDARHAVASSLKKRTVSGADAQARWAEAITSLRSTEGFEDIEVTPQLGLLPLRRDPVSGLWEFWLVASGETPMLDPASGDWDMTGDSGIVLTLVPPGPTAWVGPTTRDRDDPYFDYWTAFGQFLNETGPFAVSLDAFFVSKYEMTVGQWRRVMFEHPRPANADGALAVDSVSWDTAQTAVLRLGLLLPTEAQWEYACRAGTRTRFSTGHEDATLEGHANLGGRTNAEGEFLGPWPDDFAQTAPVGSFLPNAFGLFDMHGNVWEWTRERYTPDGEPRDGDGLRETGQDDGAAVFKGGSWQATPYGARVSRRYDWLRGNAEPDVGLRPMRPLSDG